MSRRWILNLLGCLLPRLGGTYCSSRKIWFPCRLNIQTTSPRPEPFFSGKKHVIVIIPFCLAALSNLTHHDVWFGLLDLVLRKADKCTANVKCSLNLSGMDAALPSCWPLLRYNIAPCENHLGSIVFKDLCPRPNWSGTMSSRDQSLSWGCQS